MKKIVTFITVIVAFAVKVWQGFALPVVEAGSMPMGAMNDPLAVVISGIMTAAVAWGVLEVLFWIVSNIVKSLSVRFGQRNK